MQVIFHNSKSYIMKNKHIISTIVLSVLFSFYAMAQDIAFEKDNFAG